jgi:hypothetical protein
VHRAPRTGTDHVINCWDLETGALGFGPGNVLFNTTLLNYSAIINVPHGLPAAETLRCDGRSIPPHAQLPRGGADHVINRWDWETGASGFGPGMFYLILPS